MVEEVDEYELDENPERFMISQSKKDDFGVRLQLLSKAMSEEKQKNLEEEEDDVISKSIGQFGKWQLQMTFLLSLFNIPCTWHIVAPTYQAMNRDTWCAISEPYRGKITPSLWSNCTQPDGDYCQILDIFDRNISVIDIQQCKNLSDLPFTKCSNWDYLGKGHTLISEFDLVCDRRTLRNVAEMMFLAGVALGGLVCGILSDKYGRKRTLMASVLIQSILGTAISFSPYFELYYVLRLCLGFISVSVVFSGFVLSIELVGGHWRTVAGISYLFPVSLSYMSIAGISYLIRDWRYLQLTISLPGFVFLILWWILPESPRWLLALGRTEEVMTILQNAARRNGRELPANLDKQLLPSTGESDQPKEGNVKDLFKTVSMRRKTFILFLIWFSVYLVYYGLVLNLGNIGGNIYVNSVIMGAVEIPSILISIVILIKGGRRWPLSLTMIISGLACGLTLPISLSTNDLQWMITSLAMISKFCITSSNAIIPVYTAELYPTTIRNIGVGASNVSAGSALMLVPYLWELVSIHEVVPMAAIAIFGVIGGASVLLLPETGKGPLIETVKEEEEEPRMSRSARSSTVNNNG